MKKDVVKIKTSFEKPEYHGRRGTKKEETDKMALIEMEDGKTLTVKHDHYEVVDYIIEDSQWVKHLPRILALHGQGVQLASEELFRMAEIADQAIIYRKAIKEKDEIFSRLKQELLNLENIIKEFEKMPYQLNFSEDQIHILWTLTTRFAQKGQFEDKEMQAKLDNLYNRLDGAMGMASIPKQPITKIKRFMVFDSKRKKK